MLFAALVPKADDCDSPFGLTASLLTSSLLSFFPPGLLRLHCMTFSPAPLKPWVSGEPIWPEVSLWKASRHSTRLFLSLFHHPPSPTQTPWLTSQGWTLLCFLSGFHVQSTASAAINVGVERSDSVAVSATASPPWWLFIILTTTATWRLNRGRHSGKNLLRI